MSNKPEATSGLKLDSKTREMMDGFLARLWSEEEWLWQTHQQDATNLDLDRQAYFAARKTGGSKAKFAVRWQLIQRAKKRVNSGYNRIHQHGLKIKLHAPFADMLSVLELEQMLGVGDF